MNTRVLTLLILHLGLTNAAQANVRQNNVTEPARVYESVIVIGKKTPALADDLAGSVDIIGRDELAYEHVNNTMELFSKVPGVYFSRFNQGIINTDIAIRGFAGEGSTPHAKLLIDGIPANLHNGYSEMDQLFPLHIESIQVFKGTSDPRYGLYNIAGNYSIATRADTDANKLEATLGSFDTRELQGYWGLQNDKLTHSYFLGHRSSEGYREHTDLDKYTASGRWFYSLSDTTSLGLIARVSGYEGDAPGYLTKEEARRKPTSSAPYANRDGGEKQIDHYSAHLDTQLGDDIDWSLKIYRQNFERERWIKFSATSALQNRYDDQDHAGLISTIRWRLADQWHLNWGVDTEHQDVIEQRFGTIGQTRQRDTTAAIRNHHYEFDTAGSYVQIEHAPNRTLAWNMAVRVDRIDGRFSQFDSTGAESKRDIFDFGTIVQPKFNLFVSPNERITLFANYGRSFQHPFGAGAFTVGPTDARDVSVNDGWEAGVRWFAMDNLELRISHWRQQAKDEFVTVDGIAQNVGETKRRGLDLGLNWHISDRAYLWANYTTVDSEILKPDDSQRDFTGNELRSIPDYTASLGVNYSLVQGLTLRVHADSQGDYYVNEANLGGRFGGYTLVNAALDYETTWGNLSLQVNNLFDKYYEYVFDFSQSGSATIHSPGDGVNASLSIGYLF